MLAPAWVGPALKLRNVCELMYVGFVPKLCDPVTRTVCGAVGLGSTWNIGVAAEAVLAAKSLAATTTVQLPRAKDETGTTLPLLTGITSPAEDIR